MAVRSTVEVLIMYSESALKQDKRRLQSRLPAETSPREFLVNLIDYVDEDEEAGR